MNAPIYITAPDGTRYRVFDTAWRDGKRVAANPPAEWATTRVFRAEDGSTRFYPLAYLELHGETHEPKLEWLARQLAQAERGASSGAKTLAERAQVSDARNPSSARPVG
jgi:hypothetical protein